VLKKWSKEHLGGVDITELGLPANVRAKRDLGDIGPPGLSADTKETTETDPGGKHSNMENENNYKNKVVDSGQRQRDIANLLLKKLENSRSGEAMKRLFGIGSHNMHSASDTGGSHNMHSASDTGGSHNMHSAGDTDTEADTEGSAGDITSGESSGNNAGNSTEGVHSDDVREDDDDDADPDANRDRDGGPLVNLDRPETQTETEHEAERGSEGESKESGDNTDQEGHLEEPPLYVPGQS
jgi:hypothetical protein